MASKYENFIQKFKNKTSAAKLGYASPKISEMEEYAARKDAEKEAAAQAEKQAALSSSRYSKFFDKYAQESSGTQTVAAPVKSPTAKSNLERLLDQRAIAEQREKEESFRQSEREEAAKRAKAAEKKATTPTVGEDGALKNLRYIGDRIQAAEDQWFENMKTFAEGEAGAWADTMRGIPAELKSLFTNPSDYVSEAYRKQQSGEAAAEKEAARYSAYERAAERNTAAKRMTEIEAEYPRQTSNPVVKAIGDLAASVTNMVPSVAVSAIPGVGQLMGAGVMAATAAPEAYTQARNEGASKQQAVRYSNMEAINQGLGDLLIGGVVGSGKGILSSAADTITRGASSRFMKKTLGKLATSPAGKTAVKYFGNVLGEGSEEAIQSLASTMNQRLTYNPDAKVVWSEVAYEGLLGGLMGGVFGAAQVPSNYRAYKSDADLVKTFAMSAEHITSNEEAEEVRKVGDFIVNQMDETIANADGDSEMVERATFIRDNVAAVRDTVEEHAEEIASTNNDIAEAVEAVAESPVEDIVENTARFVDAVADAAEPDVNAVNTAIDVVRDKIQEQQEIAQETDDPAEKRAAQVEAGVLKEIDSVLRNQREEIEKAREELPENNLTEDAQNDTINNEEIDSVVSAQNAAEPQEAESATTAPEEEKTPLSLEYSKQKHTKTGEELDVVKIPSRVDSDEYTRIKDQLKKIGGYYSKYQKGFVIPKDSVDKIPGILDEIGIGLSGYAPAESGAVQGSAEAPTAEPAVEAAPADVPASPAELSFPEGAQAAEVNDSGAEKHTESAANASENNNIPADVPAESETEEAKEDLHAAVQKKEESPRSTTANARSLENAILRGAISKDNIVYGKSVDGFSSEQRQYFVESLIDGLKTDSETIHTDIPYDGAFEIKNDPYTVANLLDALHVKINETEDKTVKKIVNLFKNADRLARFSHAGNTFITNGAVAIKVSEEQLPVIDKELSAHGKWAEPNKNDLLSMFASDDMSPVTKLPYKAYHTPQGKTAVLFEADDGTAVLADSDYVKFFDSKENVWALAKAKEGAGVRYSVVAMDNNSNIKGVILPMRMPDFSKYPQTAFSSKSTVLSDIPAQKSKNSKNTPSPAETTPVSDKAKKPEVQIADFVAERLSKGLSVSTADVQVVANNAYGGTQAEGKYDVKSMTDAIELGVNKHLLSVIGKNSEDFNSAKAADAVDSIREISDDILSKIPTQTKRSDEQISLQQFSTPPNIAYVAAWTANIGKNDVALEPSAGIGGLATFAKAFGAETIVNELSERRLDVLKNLPFDGFYHENAEQIDNILPDSVKPTVVIMNPPFSSTGGRTKNSTKNAIPHIEQALQRLEDGGRLVAILGRGMADDTPTFKGWWDTLRKDYNIRANIGINGENYRKYGTTFDVQLVVIDKTGPQTGETITGYYDNLEEIPAILEGVRNDRTEPTGRNQTAERNTAVESGGTAGEEIVSRGTRTDSDGGTDGVSGRSDPGGKRNLEVSDADRTGSDRKSGIVDGAEDVQSESGVRISDDDGGRGRLDGSGTSETGTESRTRKLDSGDSGTGADELSERVVQSESVTEEPPKPKKKTAKKAAENDDGVYAEYRTVPLTVKNAKKHPAKLVESSAMSAVSSPPLTYVPHLDQKLIDSGALSDAQLENISYAGQAHEQLLPNKQRKGYFIGDGTGVGKGRQLAGIIMDNWNQGRKKAIWISENKNLSEDARRDWKDLGGDPDQIIDWEKAQKKGLTQSEGILFIPYSSLAGGKTKKRDSTTLEVLEKWFGKDFDGVIVFDEAHNMGNLIPMKGARGTKKPSQKAIAGDKLQSELPNARVTYASATGATNIENLSYAARLGLWGDNTSFSDANDFITKIGRAGIAAMELVARDMKAMGVYLARSISYDGVVYDNIQHKLSTDQRKMYDGMSEGWQVVLQNFDKAMQMTDSANSKEVKQKRGQIYGNMQLFYNQVLTSMAMPTVLKDIEKQLAAGKSCVIQLVNTNEAAQDRAVSDAKSEGKTDLDDLDITPRQLLVGYVENAFPVQQYEEYLDDNGNLASRPVVDSEGKPVLNKQAVRMRDELIERLNEISIPEGPLDMLLNHFGADQVAEITGRGGRVFTVADENGNKHKKYVSRDAGKANIAETKDFQDGNKRILVFSGAGSTGRSFHSDKRAKNQQQRIHYVLQPGWKAETAVQGFGRTHRSNQMNTPVFRLVSTDVMGHKRFVTSIARRLDQLGALTKGQRQTGSGVFGEKDNLESPLSAQALREFYRRLGANQLHGLSADSVLGKMGLDKAFKDEFGRFSMNDSIASDIPKFLNRLLALPVQEQNEVFTAFEEIRDSFYQAALENGTLDTGLENVKADKIEITQDDVVYTDPATGAETRYVKAKLYTRPKLIETIEDAEGYRDGFKGIYRMQDGSVRAVYRLADRTDDYGRVSKYYALISPNTGVQSRYAESTFNAKVEAVPKSEWESVWAEELKNVPEFNESERHMITGALLPIWNRLPQTENVKAQRIVASDGSQYLGRMIQKDMVDMTLRQLDVRAQKTQYTGKQVYDEIMSRGKTATMRAMYGGTLTVTKRRVSGEPRLEVSGAGAYNLVDKYEGVFAETINYSKRYFIPTGAKGEAILDRMIKDLGGIRSLDSDDGGAFYSLGSSRGKWGKGDGKAQIMSVNELTRQASRIFGIEINTGKVGKSGAAGVFKTHAGTIRTRMYGDLPTIAHELGHWFDKKYKLTSSPQISELTDRFGDALKAAGYTDIQIPGEAVAEYFSAYMNDQADAKKKFPKFTEWLYGKISVSDQRRLFEYAGMTNAYHTADLERRADAQIHTRVQDGKPLAQAQLQLDTLLRNPSAYLGTLSRKATRMFIDDLVDLRAFGGSYDLAMFEKTADSVAAGRLTTAMTDRYGNYVGKSLETILADGSINDMNRRDFDKYLIACVALDRINAAENAAPGQKIGSLVYADEQLQDRDSLTDRIARYERENPTFHETAEQVYTYQRNLMRLAVDSGLVSEKLFEKLNESYPHYVPLYRVMDDVSASGGKAKRGYADQRSPIARFKGSGRDIYSPLENIILNTEKFTKACMRNDVMQEFTSYVDSHEDLGWAAEKVPEAKIFDVISTDSIAERLSEFESDRLNKLGKEDAAELMGEVMDFIGDYAGMWKAAAKQGKNVVSVMRGGKREYYEIHDSDLMKCLTNMDPRQTGLVMQLLGAVTAKFKVLTTGSNPIFGVTNVARDLASGYVSSTTTNNPIRYTGDFIKAWWEAIRQSKEYKEYMLNGGGWSGALTQDYKQLKHAEGEVIKTTNALKRLVTTVTDAIPRLVDAGESASRYAEYKRARDLGVDALEAIRNSQEITTNYSRGGTVVKEIDKIIPYFRASVNSMYHLFDVLAKGDKKQLASRWAKFVALNTIPAVIGIAWREIAPSLFDEAEEEVEKAYDTLSAYNKNAYWCFYVGDGKFLRSAKPKDMTVFSTVWERLVEFGMYKDQDALYGLGGYVADSLLPPTARDASIFGTALSLAENKTFTGAPIVPTAYQNLDRKLQYKGDTSTTAIALGNAFNLSPMQIDFILEDNFGYVGTLITNLGRHDGKINLGFLNKFVVDSVYSTDAANIFYDQKGQYDTNAASYKHTGGADSSYTSTDVYGKYKYGKIADTYSALNSAMKSETNADISRAMKERMNQFLSAVNQTGMTDLDKSVIDICETTGTSASDIAPYIVVPDEVTYNRNKVKEKFKLTFDEMLEYYAESQVVLTAWYQQILESGYSDDAMAQAMADVKNEIAKQMRDRWEDKKFKQKYG